MKRTTLFLILTLAIFMLTFNVVRLHDGRFVGEREKPQRSGAMEALEFWTAARAYPDDDIPADKYHKAWLSSRANIKEVSRQITSSSTWEPIGPTNLHGRSLSVAINPQNVNSVWLGTASGGLWRSYGGGLGGDWEMVSTGYPALGIGAILIDPADTNVMYAGTGETYRYLGANGGLIIRTTRGSFGIGILKSTDAGASWTKSLDWSYNQQRGIQAMKFNPQNSSTVWAATSEGMYKSTDAGATWSVSWPVLMATDVVIHTSDSNKILGAFGNLSTPAGGIYLSTDNGANWGPVGTIPPYSGKTLLTLFDADPDVVYASVCDSTTGVGALWRTMDFGSSWTQLSNSSTNAIFGVQGWYSHYVAVHPTDMSQVFHAAVGASKSNDSGVTFSGTSGLYSDNHGFAIDPTNPNVIFSANDDGIYRSTNFGQSFTSVGAGMQTGQFYKGFSQSTTDSNLAIVQSQDHIPGYIYTGGTTWGRSAVDEVGWTAIDPTDDNIMYAVFRGGARVYRSLNRGVNWSFFSSFGSTGAWNSPIAISESSPNIVYFGKSLIYKSTNNGTNWSATNGGFSLDGNPALCLGIAPTSPDTVFVGLGPLVTNAHVYRTTDGGALWTDVTGTLPDRFPMDLDVHPVDSRIVYAAMGGFGAGHVFKSTDAGGSWTDITGTLPDAPTSSIVIDPANPDIVYVGNDISVYVSTDAGSTWSAFSDGLPDGVIVSDLALSLSNRVIRVGTHGNGAYQRAMLGELPGGYFDYKAYAVGSPVSGTLYEVNSPISPLEASFRNNGATASLDSFDVKLRIVKGVTEVYSNTLTVPPLAVAEIREITFPGSFTPTDTGDFTVQAITMESDDDSGNDTLGTTLRVVLAPTITSYMVSKMNCGYSEIIGGSPGPAGDDGQLVVPLPFSFEYDGYTYNQAQISTNGWMEFGTGPAGSERGVTASGDLGCCGLNFNGQLGVAGRPTKALGPWWEDLNANAAGSAVTFTTQGTTPSRIFVVQWKNMRAYYAGATTTLVNFQVKLYETTNVFEFVYGPVIPGTFTGSDIGAMIGIKDYIGGDYRYYDFYTGSTGLAGDVTSNLSPLTDWPGMDSCYHVEPSGAGVLSVAVSSGWNMISRPLDTPDPAVGSVFPTVIGNTTWAFTKDSGYVHRDTLEAGRGYWSKFPSGVNQSVSGLPLDSVTIAVDSGWNIIGSVDHPVSAPSGGLVTGTVWGYSAGYYAATVLTPGKGFWMKASADGYLQLGASAAPKAARVNTSDFPVLHISDARGGKQDLYLAPEGVDLDAWEMPPVPPEGLFDARFSSGRAAERISDETGTPGGLAFSVRGAEYPLAVSYDLKGYSGPEVVLVERSGNRVVTTHALAGNGKIVLLEGDRSISLETIGSGAVPSNFALYQNYPNPFNPTTSISFDIPEAARVVLTVYNSLGQRMKTIVDSEYPAGTYTVEADFSELPTGVYLYRITAGSHSASRKLVLMK